MKYSIIIFFVILATVIGIPVFGAELDAGIGAFKSGRYSEALKVLLPLANAGNDEAQRIVGEMCYSGQGMKRNVTASFKWNELAAVGGNKIAQYNLGYLYEHGEGVSASRDQAIDWYTKAARQGYVNAQRKLGDIYTSSQRDTAIYWYDMARQGGDEESLKKFSSLSSDRSNEQMAQDKIRQAASDADESRKSAERRAEREADDARVNQAAEASSTPYSPPAQNQFQILNDLNKIMVDGQRMRDNQRQIAATQAAARADEQRRAQQEERRRAADERDRQRVLTQRQAQADTSNRDNQRQAESDRAAEQQRREREAQQREEQRRKDQQAQQERAQEQEKQRKRDAQDEAVRLAKTQADYKESQKRHSCVDTTTTTGNAYIEADSRAMAQKNMLTAGTTGTTVLGDPYKVLSSTISCKKEATNINPYILCVGKQVTDYSMIGPCGFGGGDSKAISK